MTKTLFTWIISDGIRICLHTLNLSVELAHETVVTGKYSHFIAYMYCVRYCVCVCVCAWVVRVYPHKVYKKGIEAKTMPFITAECCLCRSVVDLYTGWVNQGAEKLSVILCYYLGLESSPSNIVAKHHTHWCIELHI